jgi:hypothetical protein
MRDADGELSALLAVTDFLKVARESVGPCTGTLAQERVTLADYDRNTRVRA